MTIAQSNLAPSSLRFASLGIMQLSKVREEVAFLRESCAGLSGSLARLEAEKRHLRGLLEEETASGGVRKACVGDLERSREGLAGRVGELEAMLETANGRRLDLEGRLGEASDELGRGGREGRRLKAQRDEAVRQERRSEEEVSFVPS